MGRSSNDDRSDSLNPNNDSYWASEANRNNQIGRDDDDSPAHKRSIGTRDISTRIRQAFLEYSFAPHRTRYGLAILDFNGTSQFAYFDVLAQSEQRDPSRDMIASSVFRQCKAKFGRIAYARLWGPDIRNLPSYTWNTGFDEHSRKAWDSIYRDIAKDFEAKLEQLDFTDAHYLGEFSEEMTD